MPNKRNALVEGENIGIASPYLQPGETIGQDPELSNLDEGDMDDSAVSVSYDENDAGSSSDSVVEGTSGRAAQPPAVTPSVSRAIPIQQTVLRTALGTDDLTSTDSSVISEDAGLSSSLRADGASESYSDSLTANAVRPTATSPFLSATNGNWATEADTFGVGADVSDIDTSLNSDIRGLPSMRPFDQYRFSF